MVEAARAEGAWQGCSLDELVGVVGDAQEAINALHGVQTIAIANAAAIEDTIVDDDTGECEERHRGLGHISLDASGVLSPVLGCSDAAAATRVEVAAHQCSATPSLVSSMLAGGLDSWRARVITGELLPCPSDGAAVIADRLVEVYAARGGWDEPPGRVRSRAESLVAKVCPEVVAAEADNATANRRLRRYAASIGVDHWEADIPADAALPMWAAIDALAKQKQAAARTAAVVSSGAPATPLTIDQARVDALTDLVLGNATIDVVLHATTATPAVDLPDLTPTPPQRSADWSDPTPTPAAAVSAAATETNTAGPDIPAAAVSAVATEPEPAEPVAGGVHAGGAGPGVRAGEVEMLSEVGGLGVGGSTFVNLTRLSRRLTVGLGPALTCDPTTGAIIGGAVPASLARTSRRDAARHSESYAVPADTARLVRLRDGRCRFPNCTIAARFTDQDHVIPWPVGATTPTNLICLCRRHHRIKQRPGWSVRLDPDAVAWWTDPTGTTTRTDPVDHLTRPSIPMPVTPACPNPSRTVMPVAPACTDPSSAVMPGGTTRLDPPSTLAPTGTTRTTGTTGTTSTDPRPFWNRLMSQPPADTEVLSLFEHYLVRQLELALPARATVANGFSFDGLRPLTPTSRTAAPKTPAPKTTAPQTLPPIGPRSQLRRDYPDVDPPPF